MQKSYPCTRTKNKEQAYTNNINIPQIVYEDLNLGKNDLVIVDDTFVFRPKKIVQNYSSSEDSENQILLSKVQREFLNKTISDDLNISKIQKNEINKIKSLRIIIELLSPEEEEIDSNELIKEFMDVYKDFPFNEEQKFYFKFKETVTICKVTEILFDEEIYETVGILESTSSVIFKSKNNSLTIKGNKTFVDLESLGIGGLSDQFNIMFRRAFIQRSVDSDVIKKMGIDHVRGIMLHGPPGTGKTLIARQIGTLLDAKAPKIVNGPEILNKYVGQSEENIRELFKEAEEEFKLKKEKSKLHIIIFDEIDAICKKRGSSEHTDQVVNQLLSKMDGTNALNNILVIGMTNRIDLIDAALLRPGRFEIKIEISLPNEKGRFEVFKIHTKNMKINNFLSENVDLNFLAKSTENYTGAEIAAVVKSAASFALQRGLGNKDFGKEEQKIGKIKEKDLLVTGEDFIKAVNEVKPLFGIDESEFEQNKIFYELPVFKNILDFGKSIIHKLKSTNLYSMSNLLLHGRSGVGKTTLATKIAKDSKFSFARVISPIKMVGMSEYEKVNFIKETFIDAYRCEYAVIVLDELESLIDFVGIGPRFSNVLLQALKIFIKSENNNENKVFVVATGCDEDVLKDLGLLECFKHKKEIVGIDEENFNILKRENQEIGEIDNATHKSIKEIISEAGHADLIAN